MRLHGVLLRHSIRGGSREKRPDRPWSKNDAMPGFIFALMSDFVDLTNPHRGCALHTLSGNSVLIGATNRGGESLLSSANSLASISHIFHQIHAPRDGVNTPFPSNRRGSCRAGRRGLRQKFGERAKEIMSAPAGPKPGCAGGLAVYYPKAPSTTGRLSRDRDVRRISFILLDKNRLSSTMRDVQTVSPQSHEHRRKPA